MSKTNLPGFTAGASLYETTSSYRSRVTQPEGGGHAIFAQGWGSCAVLRCERQEEGGRVWYECECDIPGDPPI